MYNEIRSHHFCMGHNSPQSMIYRVETSSFSCAHIRPPQVSIRGLLESEVDDLPRVLALLQRSLLMLIWASSPIQSKRQE